MDVEGVGKAHEEVEERAVVNGFGDLGVGPADLAKPLDLLIRDAIGVPGERLDEFQQQSVFRRQVGGAEVPVAQSRRRFRVLLSLQLQEPGMAAESVVAAVERRDVRRDHFMLSAAERPVGEVQAARLIDGAQEVRSQAHRPQDVGDVSPNRCLLQLTVEVRDLTGCVVVLDPGDPCHEIPLRMDWGEPTRNTPAAAGLGPPPRRSLRPPGSKRMITKAFIYDPETREYGGNYLWERREQIDAFLNSDIVAGARKKFGEPTYQVHRVAAYLDRGKVYVPATASTS